MYNILISIACGLVVAAGIRFGTNLGWTASIVPGFLALVVVYFIVARRTAKKLEGIFLAAQKDLQSQKFDKGIQTLQAGFALAPWQVLVASQLHAQLGWILYALKQDVDAALPHLRKSFSGHWLARTMLGVALYRKHDLNGMKDAFEKTVSSSKKEGLAWSTYAWCLEKEGRHQEAIAVLGRGAAANVTDEKLRSSLQALQNGKKLKLGKLYGEQWFQFHLERIPPEMAGPARGGRRVIYQRR
jgi:tetratricopeptide (TPR) repeat protein